MTARRAASSSGSNSDVSRPNRDPQTLARVRPGPLRVYLSAQGWRLECQRDVSETWTLPKRGGVFEVMVPLDPLLRDYGYRIAEILQTLEAVEERDRLQVLADLLSPGQEGWPPPDC